MRFVLFFLLVCHVVNLSAQNYEWAKSMGGPGYDFARCIVTDKNDNIYTTGVFAGTADFDPGPANFFLTSVGDYDIFISKLDSTGNFVWAKKIGGPASDFCQSIGIDTNKNIYLTGRFFGTVDFDPGIGLYNLTTIGTIDIFILKLDSNGNFVLAKNIGGILSAGIGTSIAISEFGSIYCTGGFGGNIDFDPGPGTFFLNGTNDIFVWKLDLNGNFNWATKLGGGDIDEPQSIKIDLEGNIYATGLYRDTVDFDPGLGVYNLISNGWDEIFVSKLDSSGNFLWAKSIGGVENDIGFSISIDNDKNVYTTGWFRNTVDFDPGGNVYNLTSNGNSDIFISKLDSNGNFEWAKNIGGFGMDIGYSVCLDNFSNVYTTGSYTGTVDFDPGLNIYNLNSFGSNEIFILKLDSNGNFISAKHIGGTGADYGRSIVLDSHNNILIAGEFGDIADFNPPFGANLTANGFYEAFIAKYNQCIPTISFQTYNSCDSFLWNGNNYTISGTYIDTISNVAGCDSIVTLNVTINYSSDTVLTQTACTNYTLNGQTYNATGVYTQTLINATACDSVITLNLTINQPTTNTITQTACTSYTLNGQTYTSSGTYTQTLINAVNCDSIITLNLTINQPTASTITQTACNSYTFNGQTYNTSGTYTQTLTNAVNCDSIITLNLTINNADSNVTQSGSTLTANAAGATYQWLSCNPFQEIIGETNQVFNATVNGDYAVVLTENGCTDTSACFTVIGIGINDYNEPSNIRLYPNPITQKLFIESEIAFQNATIKILNIAGQTVIEHNNISSKKFEMDMSKFVSGTYFVEIADNGFKYIRVVTKE